MPWIRVVGLVVLLAGVGGLFIGQRCHYQAAVAAEKKRADDAESAGEQVRQELADERNRRAQEDSRAHVRVTRAKVDKEIKADADSRDLVDYLNAVTGPGER